MKKVFYLRKRNRLGERPMHYYILGQLSVRSTLSPVSLPPKPQQVLASLVVNIGQVTYVDELIDEVWRDDPPASAATTLQTYVCKVRQLLGRAGHGTNWIVTRPQGYLLQGEPSDVDMYRFVDLVEQARGRIEDEPAAVGDLLRRALQMWRGPAFGGMRRGLCLESQAERLEELRLCAVEMLLRSSISMGRHSDVINDLRSLIVRHPYNELLHGYLMFSLAACGRRHDALRVYGDLQESFRNGLGLDPSTQLVVLSRELLAGSAISLPFAETR
ncbi:MAG: AfsR/SARP family transcriptional regulator [Geodermatophilaceae bacterium]